MGVLRVRKLLRRLRNTDDVEVLLANGDKGRAASVLRRRLTEEPENPRHALRLADVLELAGESEEAVRVLVPAVDAYARDGFLAKAVAVLKRIERLDPDRTESAERWAARLRAGSAGEDNGALQAPRLIVGERSSTPSEANGRRSAPLPTSELRFVPPEDLAGRTGLSDSPLFEGLSTEELTAWVGGLRLKVTHPGAIIVSQDEEGSSLLILASGSARVYVRSATAKNVQIDMIAGGAFFGAGSLLEGRPRPTTVIAAGECELLELDREAFARIESAHPDMRRRLTRYIGVHSP